MVKCKFCDEYHLELKKEKRTANIKGKLIKYDAEYYFCPELEESFEDGELINKNLNNARNNYRELAGLLTTHEIVAVREHLGLSQRDLAILLGMGEASISRIESKVIQDKTTDDSIRRISEDPMFLLEKLESNKEKLGKKYEKVRSLLNLEEEVCIYSKKILDVNYYSIKDQALITGNRSLNLEKVENIIIFFTKNCRNVFKTKLNKLMWFSDFLNYKERETSITGLAYTHMTFGAVPVGVDEILKCFKNIKIEERENIDFGFIYNEITPIGEFNYDLFSKDEIKVLEKVAKKFKNFGNREISDYMHEEEAYVKTNPKEYISYSFAKNLREF